MNIVQMRIPYISYVVQRDIQL